MIIEIQFSDPSMTIAENNVFLEIFFVRKIVIKEKPILKTKMIKYNYCHYYYLYLFNNIGNVVSHMSSARIGEKKIIQNNEDGHWFQFRNHRFIPDKCYSGPGGGTSSTHKVK